MLTRNQKAKQLKNDFRNRVRKSLRVWREDPFIADAMKFLAVDMVKWDVKNDAVLICVYDNRKGRSDWPNEFCQWEWINLFSRNSMCYNFAYYRFWEMCNKVLGNIKIDLKNQEK